MRSSAKTPSASSVAIARAERALLAEEVGDDAVGRMLEAQHAMHELGLRLEQGGRMHRADYPCRFRDCRDAPWPSYTGNDRHEPRRADRAHRPDRAPARASAAPALPGRRRARRLLLAGRSTRALARVLVGWNVLVWLYLVWVAVALAACRLRTHQAARAGAGGERAVALAIVVSAAVISLVALVFELSPPRPPARSTWLPHLLFALRHACSARGCCCRRSSR